MNFFSAAAIALPLLLVSPGSESIPFILQQVRVGNPSLIPNTAMSPPVALVHPAPIYTTEARQAGVRGTVTVRAEFDIDGNFRVLEIEKGLGYGLDERALEALEDWRFRPAYRSGRRVAVVASIDIEFVQPPDSIFIFRAAPASGSRVFRRTTPVVVDAR